MSDAVEEYANGHDSSHGLIEYVNINIDGEDIGLCIETKMPPRHGETVTFGHRTGSISGKVVAVEHVFTADNGLRRHYYVIDVSTEEIDHE